MNTARRLATANIGIAVAAFGVAAAMALMQAVSRANLDLPWRSPKMYYLSVTAHGVLMALVFTTFFIMGLGIALTTHGLGRRLRWPRVGWASFWVAVAGTLAALWAIFWGKATVLYTFYPPLQAHPAFYIGLTLLVVGSWVWSAVIVATYRAWRAEHREQPVPLAVFGMLATIIVWLLATFGWKRVLPWLAVRLGRQRLVPLGLAGIGLCLVGLALVQPLASFMDRASGPLNPENLLGLSLLQTITMALAGPLGFSYALLNAPAQTVLHERAPPHMRGRIFAVQAVLANSLALMPVLFIGGLTDLLGQLGGPPGITIVLLLIAAAVTALAAVTMRWQRGSP